jgi:hypothetical protein
MRPEVIFADFPLDKNYFKTMTLKNKHKYFITKSVLGE